MQPKNFITLLLVLCTAVLMTNAQNKNPYKELGKKGETLTLTKGQFDEFFDEGDVQQVGTNLVNIRTMKVVKMMTEDEAEKRLDNTVGKRFLSVDPIASKFPMLSPYQYASNSPIESVDIDGLERISQKLIMENGTPKLTTISVGPQTRSFGQMLIDAKFERNIPLQFHVQYNDQTYNFSPDYRNLNNGLTPTYSMKDYFDFISNPNEGNYRSQDEANSDFQHEILMRSAYALAAEAVNRSAPFINGMVANRGRYSTVTGANNKVKEDTYSPTQQITVKRTDPQEGFSATTGKEFRGVGFNLVNGKLLGGGGKGMTGTYDFIVNNEGRLLLGTGHYYLSKGASTVQAAGTLQMWNGKVKTITAASGHYQPTQAEANNFKTILENIGVNVSSAKLKPVSQ